MRKSTNIVISTVLTFAVAITTLMNGVTIGSASETKLYAQVQEYGQAAKISSLCETVSSDDNMREILMEKLTDAISDAEGRLNYKYEIGSAVRSSEYELDTYNYRQQELNEDYKARTGKAVNGTCAQVSLAIMMQYYARKGYINGDTNINLIYKRLMDISINKGYYSNGGTQKNLIDNVASEYLKDCGSSLRGNNDILNLKSTIKSYINNKKPVLANVTAPNGEGHAVVIAGVYEITVEYKSKKNDSYKKKTYTYYAVNDGAQTCTSGERRIQYVRAEYIDSICKFK